MNRLRLLFAALAATVALPSASAKVTALVGGRLIDGWGGAPVNNSVVLIEGERIKAVGTADSLPVPAGAEVIDCRGMSVLPGLWDCHVHTMLLGQDRKSTRLNSSHIQKSRMPSSA